MEKYHDLFVASAGAAAAFIGLLFVAISLAPERIIGRQADSYRHSQARRAFVAFANIFFISIVGLIPDIEARPFMSVAVTSIVISALYAYPVIRKNGLASWRHWGLVSIVGYGFEWYTARKVGTDVKPLVGVVIFTYLYALFSVWDLLESREAAEEKAEEARDAGQS